MQCIFGYCKEDLSSEIFVVAYYAALVLAAVGLSLLARSRAIRTAALLIAGAWALSLFAFFYVRIPAYFPVVVILDAVLAYRFGRMAKVHFFPAPLCVLQLVEIAFVAVAVTAGLPTYWTLFVMNRLFELTLIYLIGCALFRIHLLRRQRKSKTPITGWRANFVVQ